MPARTPGPRTLAAVRIGVGLGLIVELINSRGFILPPEGLRFPPPGTDWLPLPASQVLFQIALVAGIAGGLMVTAGYRPRMSAPISLVAFLYVGWATALTGKVDHLHHIVWVLAVVAVSPSANAWAIRRESRAGSFSTPVMAVMVLIGLTYFGAGLQKFFTAGLEWAWSNNLQNIIHGQAWEKGHPVPGLADNPSVLKPLALAALLFELSFLPLLLLPFTRRWVWPAGLFFHWGTWALLGISFVSLQLLYVAFLPLDSIPPTSPPEATRSQRYLIATIVGSVAVFSLIGISSAWPLAAYPGFETTSPVVREIELDDGYLKDSQLAERIRPWRARVLGQRAISQGKTTELAEWFRSETLVEVQVNLLDGEVLERIVLR